MPDKDGPVELKKLFPDLLSKLVGRKWAIVIFVVCIASFAIWWNWDDVKKRPFVKSIITTLTRKGIPTASPGSFTVLVSHLVNDEGHMYETLIVEALKEHKGVEVFTVDRTVKVQDAGSKAEEEGHKRARKFLKQSKAHVLIWGQVLKKSAKSDTGVPKLHMTTSGQISTGRYSISEKNRNLPEELFWKDLKDVLRLVVFSQYAEFQANEGHYIADQLLPFIDKLKKLLKDTAKDRGWSNETKENLYLVLAESLSLGGKQSGGKKPLEESIDIFNKVLNTNSRKRDPHKWAKNHNNLGATLAILGEMELYTNGKSESGTKRLEEAVSAFLEALKVHTRKRFPRDWAIAQDNLGSALAILGENESGTKRLDEAVAAFREALKERTRKRVPLQWATTQNNLCAALRGLALREPGTYHLEKAEVACKKALLEYTRAREPLDWAMTQYNLANVLILFCERKLSINLCCKAINTHLASWEILLNARANYYSSRVSREIERDRGTLKRLGMGKCPLTQEQNKIFERYLSQSQDTETGQ